MSRQGMPGCSARKSSLRESAASLMISGRRSAESCLIRSLSQASRPDSRISAIWVTASRMSGRALRPGGLQVDGLREDGADVALQPTGRHDVNRAAEEFRQVAFHADQVEQGTLLVEVDQEVDVAAGPVVAAGRRAENADPAGVVVATVVTTCSRRDSTSARSGPSTGSANVPPRGGTIPYVHQDNNRTWPG